MGNYIKQFFVCLLFLHAFTEVWEYPRNIQTFSWATVEYIYQKENEVDNEKLQTTQEP